VVNAPGALPLKQKKLIAIALAVSTRCEECVLINVKAARLAGATDAEIAEAASLGIAFGGAPAAMFYERVRKRA
jgi:AhpD family alkylhydroperoxidase